MRVSAKLSSGAVVLLLLGSACADPPAEPAGPSSGSDQTRYQGDVFVLDEPDRGPVMCVGGVAESLPPQCEGIPIVGWDWSAVQGEETASNTTWGSFHVVGTYDGDTFSVLDAGPSQVERSRGDPVDTPCPEPDGGWTAPDPTKASENDLLDLLRAVQDAPDFAGFWIDYVEEPFMEGPIEPAGIIANVAFTTNVDPHAAGIREIWGGPICLVQHERTYEELRRIQRELSDGAAAELGLEVTGSGVSQQDNRVEVGVVVASEAALAAIDDRYGEGTVLLMPELEPVPA